MHTLQDGLHASGWEADGLRLWAVVNATDRTVAGPLMTVGATEGRQFWDLLKGVPVLPAEASGSPVLAGEIGAHGIAAYAAGHDRHKSQLVPLLRSAPAVGVVPPPPSRTEPSAAAPGRRAAEEVPRRSLDVPRRGMRRLGGSSRELVVRFRLRECGMDNGPAPLVNAVAPALHDVVTEHRSVSYQGFAIDERPVTNGDFLRFLEDGYRAPNPENYLRHWPELMRPPEDGLGSPVVFVDMNDAAAYSQWAGKRLPTPEEWQIAMEDGGIGYGPERVWEWTAPESSTDIPVFACSRVGAIIKPGGRTGTLMEGLRSRLAGQVHPLLAGPGPLATIGFRCALDCQSTNGRQADCGRSRARRDERRLVNNRRQNRHALLLEYRTCQSM